MKEFINITDDIFIRIGNIDAIERKGDRTKVYTHHRHYDTNLAPETILGLIGSDKRRRQSDLTKQYISL